MIPAVTVLPTPQRRSSDANAHVLVVARDATVRAKIAEPLLDAGLRVSTAKTFGVVEILLEEREAFDLLVVAQTLEETTLFGVPQLARSVDPDLPILVFDSHATQAHAVTDLVRRALRRWPLREHDALVTH